MKFLKHTLLKNHFLLTPSRCIFWEDEKTLILSDLYLGKAAHFRKSGIGIPPKIFQEDMHRLLTEIHFFNPDKMIVVGDLFHSTDNKEHQLFEKWRSGFGKTQLQLVKGNHDILLAAWYSRNGIELYDHLTVKQFSFTHDVECDPAEGYCFSGHIHPGITLRGKGKQTLKFACFYFGVNYAILPAFGKFTVIAELKTTEEDDVFIIANDEVLPLRLS